MKNPVRLLIPALFVLGLPLVRGADSPAPLTRDQDYRRMFELLHLPFPGPLPAMTADPNRPADSVLNADGRHWTDRAGDGLGRSGWGTWTNYDEARANPFPLTDPLRLKDGEEVADAAGWWRIRRPEILRDFETEIYGAIPPTPPVTWEVAAVDPGALGGIAIRKTVVGHIDNAAYPAASPRIELTLWIPAGAAGPVPAMIVVDGSAPQEAKLPAAVREVLAMGWAYGSYDCGTVQADTGAGFGGGIIGLVNRGRPRQPGDWGVLEAWAWGLSRTIDYLETDRSIDASRLGVEGHSRRGKTALLAAALDPRWAVCYASCSGEGGAKPSRRNWGETLDDVASVSEYHWMAGNFIKYATHWGDLPVDSPELMALVAPRGLFVTGGTRDQWADPRGEFLACVAVGPVYRLLGARDLGTASMPAPDHALVSGDIAFRYHQGGHLDDLDWPTFLQFAARHFRESRSVAVR
jgi:hypothetical protein